MKRLFIILTILFWVSSEKVDSQVTNDTVVYLLTCNPGTETYSIYGHSALRITDNANQTDWVYNWGVFDFSTPNFAWKFAKGRLEYMLVAETPDDFLRTYLYEKRSVYSQRLNLLPSEIRTLMGLVAENMRPENVRYRYDFFYDDCSTRIRDLIEKAAGKNLIYPPDESYVQMSFRDLTGKYQAPYPWLRLGIDLIMGSPGDKIASFRERMFLPLDMQDGLSETVVNRDGKLVPLLQNPEILLDFELPDNRADKLFSPENVFALILILLIIIIPLLKKRLLIDSIDIIIFLLFSALSVLMIFFNFFTDHQQMKINLNILWLNPVNLVCLLYLFMRRPAVLWFRMVFVISVIFLLTHMILPQDFNIGILPLVIIMAYRSSARSAFSWNPFNLT